MELDEDREAEVVLEQRFRLSGPVRAAIVGSRRHRRGFLAQQHPDAKGDHRRDKTHTKASLMAEPALRG